jgi:hypothetical protein
MRLRAAVIVLAAAGLAAGPARSQSPPPADPIDALLRHQPAPIKVIPPEEPDTAASGSQVEPDVAVPQAPPDRRPPAPKPGAPTRLDETGKSPDGPPTAADVAYDNRIRAGLMAAEGFMGPLDGGWTLLAGGKELYVLQLADRNGELQGAWRDPRRAGQPDSSGLIDEIVREGAAVRLRFAAVSGVLRPAGSGGWSGELIEGGRTQSVKLARRNP